MIFQSKFSYDNYAYGYLRFTLTFNKLELFNDDTVGIATSELSEIEND